MPERINVNGLVTPPESASVSPLDRGFLYGDSVYETLRTYGGRLFLLREHLERLRRSAERLEIPWPAAPVDIEHEVRRTVDEAAEAECAVRVILSRGRGPIGYAPEPCGPPTVVVHARPFSAIPPSFVREGVDVAVVDVTRNARSALDPAIKSSNLLNNFLAWRAAHRLGAYEPILLNADGRLVEGATSNLFVVRSGRLLTPPLDDGLLEGITRGVVLELARGARMDVAEEPLGADALRSADEAFLTSTLKGVLPIKRCDGWPIGPGRPGPVTRRIHDLFEKVAVPGPPGRQDEDRPPSPVPGHLESQLLVEVPEHQQVDAALQAPPRVRLALGEREAATELEIRARQPLLETTGDRVPRARRQQAEGRVERPALRHEAPGAVLAVLAVHQVAVRQVHPPSADVEIQRLRHERVERPVRIQTRQEKIVISLDIQQGATAGAQAGQGLDDAQVMRAEQIGRADPDGEQIAEDRQGADVGGQLIEEPDERCDLVVRLAQVGVSQQDHGGVRSRHAPRRVHSAAHQVGESPVDAEVLQALRAGEVFPQQGDEPLLMDGDLGRERVPRAVGVLVARRA